MKQGKKKFTATTQGARTQQGSKQGERFVKSILEILDVKFLDLIAEKKFVNEFDTNKNYYNRRKEQYEPITIKMTPDFIIRNNLTNKFLLIESKYKQISGSDWEKLESNFGYHKYFYADLCKNKNFEIVVILSGYWRDCQKNYDILIEYIKKTYGENSIFDFGDNFSEIERFANFIGYGHKFLENKEIIKEKFFLEKDSKYSDKE